MRLSLGRLGHLSLFSTEDKKVRAGTGLQKIFLATIGFSSRVAHPSVAIRAKLVDRKKMDHSAMDIYLERIRDVNSPQSDLHTLYPFHCDNHRIGGIKEDIVKHLSMYPEVFSVDTSARMVTLNDRLNTADKRTEAVGDVLEQLRRQEVIGGWRNELYPVVPKFEAKPLFLVERAASVTLGIKSYGVHINGYIIKNDKIYMWVAKRSKLKPTWPSRLDHIAAGGQPYGIGVMENVIKECGEEAGIPADVAKKAKSVGAVSYAYLQDAGFKQDVLFCFDLLLPEDFVPIPVDGEVEEFALKPIEEIEDFIQKTKDYKPNCALVVIDFLLRHGFISPDQEKYLELVQSLQSIDLS